MSSETIFHITGYSLAGLGFLVAVWALAAGDVRRSRRGPRCPKCWYDMSGAKSGLTCPECGHEARSVRTLLKRRRRWKFVAASLVLSAMGYGAWTTPRVQRAGWVGGVPTTAMIAALPWIDPVGPPRLAWMNGSWEKDSFSGQLVDELVSRRIANREMWDWQTRMLVRRCAAGDRARPACSIAWEGYYERMLRTVESSLHSRNARLDAPILGWFNEREDGLGGMQMVTRDCWPAGLPVYAYVTHYRYRTGMWGPPGKILKATKWALEPVTPGITRLSGSQDVFPSGGCVIEEENPWSDSLTNIGAAPAGVSRLEYEQRLEFDAPARSPADRQSVEERAGRITRVSRTVREGRVSAPIRVVAEEGRTPIEIAKTIVRPVTSEDIAEGLKTKTRVYDFALRLGGSYVVVSPNKLAGLMSDLGVTLALRVELLRDGAVMAEREVWWRSVSSSKESVLAPFWTNGLYFDLIAMPENPEAEEDEAEWSLRLTGDPVVALRDFDAKAYWDGQVTVPIKPAQTRAGR